MNRINPTTRVGVLNFEIELQSETLPKHHNNVHEMIDFVEANYEEILAQNFTHPDLKMHLFMLFSLQRTIFFVQ